jgi:two-component system phosphate regulon response regulator PhoB
VRPAAGRPTVLVVEDDAPVRQLYRAALTSAGYAVVAVEDGIDALRRVDAKTPHAVVLDLALPRLGGLDVHRELKARPETSNIPVVIATGIDISDLDPSEFACVLRKPISADALVMAVENCLRRVRFV